MKKNLLFMLSLSAIIFLAGCGEQKIENPDIDNAEGSIVAADENYQENEDVNADHSEWVATSLSVEDLERIEETIPPISYDYETYDMMKGEIINSGKSEWESDKLFIPEYENMVSREVTSSGIEDDMIYTLTNITLEDGSILQVLYVNEPDTLFCRAISVQNGDLTTLYSNFVYAADVQ